ncbi:hypothetical protein ACQZV8_11690 [Magnetococcales bacterium HHB-1]
MLDFNHQTSFRDHLNERIDEALEAKNRMEKKRNYLGASRLGVSCQRALQYEYTHTPKDEGRDFSGRTLRIFAAGHLFEELAIQWLRAAGFDLYTTRGNRPGGQQFGFSTAGGRIKGHVDGIFAGGPEELAMEYPALWECKSLNNRSWKDTVKKGVTISKPVYAAQIAIYQAYMEPQIPGISTNPALFTAINKDSAEIYHELVPFNGALAQKMSDKGVNILKATEAGEQLPRHTQTPTHFECKFCDWQDQCWRKEL